MAPPVARRSGVVLDVAILAVLAGGPLHGYAIRRALEDRIGLLWPVNQGQVYSTLARLARSGLVSVVAPPGDTAGPRLHQRTPAGAARLAQWLQRPTPPTPPGGELPTKLAIAAECGGDSLRRFARRQSAACADLAATHRADRAARGRGASRDATAIAREAAIALLDADAAWLAEAVDALGAGAADEVEARDATGGGGADEADARDATGGADEAESREATAARAAAPRVPARDA